ncbi:MAG: carbamoyltransferase C-terminal domain-containing protein [Candidatus Thermoplasmatota archaeon]
MTSTLGVYDGHDSGAALLDDGQIYAVNEERLSREKYHRSFPERSIKKVLELSGIKGREIDEVAIGGTYRNRKRLLTLKEGLKKSIGEAYRTMKTVPHHLAHAAGAYFTSGWDECTVITIDAAGDGLSSGIYLGEDQKLKKIAESSYLDSAGDFYASITEMLGFRPMRDEGNVMALAAYHDEEMQDLSGCIEVKGLGFENHLKVTGSESVKKISEEVDFPLNRREECSDVLKKGEQGHELWDAAVRSAGSAQKHIENMVNELSERIKRHEMVEGRAKEKVCCAGGVFQNVKVNKILKENFEDCWIFPHMGDGGLALGAALYFNSQLSPSLTAEKRIWDWSKDLKSVFLGPKFTSNRVEKALSDRNDLDAKKVEEKEEIIADMLVEGETVGIFQGKVEYGPRALGNRSILADPSKKESKKVLNRKLDREAFQPFSPTILKEYMDAYLKAPKTNKFMTMSFDITEKAERDLEGAIHVDGTCRPQIIEERDNETFYRTIKKFEERTGIGAVLNTSFNLHGDPIVCTPEEAIESFKKIELDALLLENYLVREEYR